MTRGELVERVAAQLAKPLDETAVQAVETAWEILAGEQPGQASAVPLRFEGDNLLVTEYEALSEEKKADLMHQLEVRNREWLRQQFERLPGDWLIVVDGEVVAHGTMETYPSDEEFDALCQRFGGRYPFVFENPLLSLIEEGSSAWHSTTIASDVYPSIAVELASPQGAAAIEADRAAASDRPRAR